MPDSSYAAFGAVFGGQKTLRHAEAHSNGKGVSNNLAESFNARVRRLTEGAYLSISHKYLSHYAVEGTRRTDTRKLSGGKSLWFRGYTHGHHRKSELLIEGDEPALGRGRQEGWKPRYAR